MSLVILDTACFCCLCMCVEIPLVFKNIHFLVLFCIRMLRKNGQFASVKDKGKIADSWESGDGTPQQEHV